VCVLLLPRKFPVLFGSWCRACVWIGGGVPSSACVCSQAPQSHLNFNHITLHCCCRAWSHLCHSAPPELPEASAELARLDRRRLAVDGPWMVLDGLSELAYSSSFASSISASRSLMFLRHTQLSSPTPAQLCVPQHHLVAGNHNCNCSARSRGKRTVRGTL
jgi:hypothetical protein